MVCGLLYIKQVLWTFNTWNSRIFLADWQLFWNLSVLLLTFVHLDILVVFSDHSTFPFLSLQWFWVSCSHRQAHSCCVTKAPAPTIRRLYQFLLLFKQSLQNKMGGQKVFYMSDLMFWQKAQPHTQRSVEAPNNISVRTWVPPWLLAGLSQRRLSPKDHGWHPSWVTSIIVTQEEKLSWAPDRLWHIMGCRGTAF